jgi:hypothetical protein
MKADLSRRIPVWLFAVSAVVTVFTGFGNMPLYGRYYIADIPGLGWSGDFFINLYVHYVAAGVLLAVSVFGAIRFAAGRSSGLRLTLSGAARAAILATALASGLVMALRNLPGVNLPFALHAGLNFLHMGAAVFFTLFALGCAAARCRWLKTETVR